MIKIKFLYKIFLKRWEKTGKLFQKWMDKAAKADTLSKEKIKCFRKAHKILRERDWLLDHMFPQYRKKKEES